MPQDVSHAPVSRLNVIISGNSWKHRGATTLQRGIGCELAFSFGERLPGGIKLHLIPERWITCNLKRIFSPDQIRCLKNGKKAIRWSKEDIIHALEPRTVSHN